MVEDLDKRKRDAVAEAEAILFGVKDRVEDVSSEEQVIRATKGVPFRIPYKILEYCFATKPSIDYLKTRVNPRALPLPRIKFILDEDLEGCIDLIKTPMVSDDQDSNHIDYNPLLEPDNKNQGQQISVTISITSLEDLTDEENLEWINTHRVSVIYKEEKYIGDLEDNETLDYLYFKNPHVSDQNLNIHFPDDIAVLEEVEFLIEEN